MFYVLWPWPHFVHTWPGTCTLRYTNEARITYLKADKRDPEWVFYDVTRASMAAYAVKPAAFDFLLTLGILAYLGVIYVFLQVGACPPHSSYC